MYKKYIDFLKKMFKNFENIFSPIYYIMSKGNRHHVQSSSSSSESDVT